MREKTIVAKIKKHLEQQGFWVVKLHGSPFATAGLPDLLALKAGRAWFFEVKGPDGVVSKLQAAMLERLRSAGCTAGVVRSVADVDQLLRTSPAALHAEGIAP